MTLLISQTQPPHLLTRSTMNFSWAESYPEVLKVCQSFQLHFLNNPTRYRYKPLKPYMQKGPQCGIVALAMCLGNVTEVEVEKLQNDAIKQGFSTHGEMFSAANMAILARDHLPCVQVEIYTGILDTFAIKEGLLNGDVILVPHDTSKSNVPGFEKGAKAHWAVVSGGVETEDDFYVIVRHGKVRNVGIWKLSDLSRSNAQLYEFECQQEPRNYKFPPGGIAGPYGLNCQAVILKEFYSFA